MNRRTSDRNNSLDVSEDTDEDQDYGESLGSSKFKSSIGSYQSPGVRPTLLSALTYNI